MTIDEIVTLIQAVSDNGLTSFVYEEGDQKLVLKKKKKKNVAQAPVAPVVISQPADDGHNADADGSRSGCGI